MQVLRVALRSRATTQSITGGSHAFAASIRRGVERHVFYLVSAVLFSATVGCWQTSFCCIHIPTRSSQVPKHSIYGSGPYLLEPLCSARSVEATTGNFSSHFSRSGPFMDVRPTTRTRKDTSHRSAADARAHKQTRNHIRTLLIKHKHART